MKNHYQNVKKIILEIFDNTEAQILNDYLIPCPYFELTKNPDILIGKSKFGGFPDLPKHIAYPNNSDIFKQFLCQINLSDLSKIDTIFDLPKTGMLYFFVQIFHFDENGELSPIRITNRNQIEIFYIEDISKLNRVEYPDFYKDSAFCEYQMTFAQNYNTLDLNDPLLPVKLDLDKYFLFKGKKNEYLGVKSSTNNLFSYPQAMSEETYCGWSEILYEYNYETMKVGIYDFSKKMIQNESLISIIEFSLPEEKLRDNDELAIEGVFNLGIKAVDLKAMNLNNIAFSFSPT
jgi:uncharacterized protein YwqG